MSLAAIAAPLAFAASAEPLAGTVISQEPRYYNGWPTVTRRANGELLLVYSGGREAHVCPFGRVEITSSRDSGQTWTAPRVLIDSATDDRDAGILETSRGTLLVTFFTSINYRQRMQDVEFLTKAGLTLGPDGIVPSWRIADARTTEEEKQADVYHWLIRSTDGGLTWSPRQIAPCSSPHGPIALADGRLLYVGKELKTGQVGAWVSADDGLNWNLAGAIPAREGEKVEDYHELHAVQAADGRLIAQIRNHAGKERYLLQTESIDGGQSWTPPREIDVRGYPSHLLRLRDGTLLMSYSWRHEPYGIRARISRDNGSTWGEEQIISCDGPNWDLGYPSSVELERGELLTVWYEVPGEGRKAVIRQARWRLGPENKSRHPVVNVKTQP